MRNEMTHWQQVEQRDWQLWLLSTFLLLILGVGLLTFMFPTAFWSARDSALSAPQQRAFVGFTVLFGLALVYLLQRQAEIRHLRTRLFEAQAAVAEAEVSAVKEFLQALPGQGPYRDALAMEYRRASIAGHQLGTAILSFPYSSPQTVGRAARHLCSTIRAGESLYRVAEFALALILPKMAPQDVAAFISRVEASSGVPKGWMDATIVCYPSEAASLAEMEGRLRELKLSA
jgi:hypothetical protein